MSSTFLFLNFVSLSSFHPYFILIGWFQHFGSATHFVRYKTMPCEFCIFFSLDALHRRSHIQTHFVMFGFDQSITPMQQQKARELFCFESLAFFSYSFSFCNRMTAKMCAERSDYSQRIDLC